MLFLIVARGRDTEEARSKKAELGPRQGELVRGWATEGMMKFAGNLVGESNASGSLAIVEFEGREALDRWLKEHPYQVHGVWSGYEVWEIQTGPIFSGTFPRRYG